MISYECRILKGSFTHCQSHWWGKDETERPCFKLYYVTGGEGTMVIRNHLHKLQPDNLYFISGHEIEDFWCDDFLDVYWLHFVPMGLFLDHGLRKCEPFQVLPQQTLVRWQNEIEDAANLCRRSSLANTLHLQAMLMYIIGDILQGFEDELLHNIEIIKLLPGIEYMDQHWKENPPLELIAKQVSLAPNYFHNVFKEHFSLTPYRYMLQKRMTVSKELLLSTDMTVQQISLRTGYDCPFHFSKVYKNYYNVTPTQQRSAFSP